MLVAKLASAGVRATANQNLDGAALSVGATNVAHDIVVADEDAEFALEIIAAIEGAPSADERLSAFIDPDDEYAPLRGRPAWITAITWLVAISMILVLTGGLIDWLT